MKSMYITNGRSSDLGTFKYICKFHQSQVADRVWKALMVLEDKKFFSFLNVEIVVTNRLFLILRTVGCMTVISKIFLMCHGRREQVASQRILPQ